MGSSENYIEKVASAISFIEEHLESPLELQDVCRHVAVSKFYFSRIFQATVGETIFDYIRKRRLSEIARALVEGRDPIVDVALRYGYESQQSMTKAFGRVYHVTPAQYRKDGRHRFFFNRKTISAEEVRALAHGFTFRFRVVALPDITIVGLQRDLPIVDPQPVEQVRAEFSRRSREVEASRRYRGIFEVTVMDRREMIEYTADRTFRGVIGYGVHGVSETPSGCVSVHIPSQRYLNFRYRGDAAIGTLSNFYRHIFSTGLLERKEVLADRSFFHYYPHGHRRASDGTISILFFIPIV